MTQAERDKIIIELRQAIIGNGVKGLAERMDEAEGWQEDHKNAHRDFIEGQHAYRIERENIVSAMLFHMVGFARVGKRINFIPTVVSNEQIPLAEITFK